MALPLTSRRIDKFSGTARVPGDKSISHRALMLALLAEGETMIAGLLKGHDVLRTAAAVRALGAILNDGADGLWRVIGTDGNPAQPSGTLDMGNSGTAVRLLAGLVAGFPVTVAFDGDASLRRRPMKRIIEPLSQMGAAFTTETGALPLTVGGGKLKAITYTLPVASAQVKSAILLAGLNADGVTTVIEPRPTRDHTENMLRHFGAAVTVEKRADGSHAVSLRGGQRLLGCAVDVPADPSSAAFPAVAACLVPGAEMVFPGLGVNPRRMGLFETLAEMGADISFAHKRAQAGEPVAAMTIRGGKPLRGVTVPASRVADMIDEFPALAVAAACAEGKTTMTGLAELRVKESDRLAMIAAGLEACGVKAEAGPDSLIIHGTGKPPRGGAIIKTDMDHRIAMSFLVLGMVSEQPVTIDDGGFIETSFPGFVKLMNILGADMKPAP
jgi:3-phosphoshikimate 1-carboxyvinyltransferase